MKKITAILSLFLCFLGHSQIKGTISDEKGNPLPFVNVMEENTYNGTTSNEQGKYELNLKLQGQHKIIFQYLGYKTLKQIVDSGKNQQNIDVILQEENFTLNEVVINTKENPAIAVIKNAIASKKENSEKTAHYKADFYSRGIFKIKDLPKKIMGVKVDLDDQIGSNLDSTGSGIIYLSETFSKLTFEKPNNLNEKVIASKISGNDKGFSYNTARSTAYDFYNNTLAFNVNMVSPLADNAFNYYKYKLEGTFFDENNHQIYKIKITPKRDKEPVFDGYIYIVDDTWDIYAVDVAMKGFRMQNEFVETMELKQNFSYNATSKIWSKNAQSLSFVAGFMGIKFYGKFNYVYSNYAFFKQFEKKTFSHEILSFEQNANKKDAAFWNISRPIPLTNEETNDYIKKDSIQVIHQSKKYLDSIDAKKNKFKIVAVLSGYDYKNSFQKWSMHYDGIIGLNAISFNTVQGYTLTSGLNFKKWNDEKGRDTELSANFNYGFDETKLRVNGAYSHRFNRQNYAMLTLSGGTKIAQFNTEQPISNFINAVSSLFFRNNFMKLYDKIFGEIKYNQDVANGVNLIGKLEYQERKPLYNTTDFSIIKSDDLYSSNNPMAPTDFVNAVVARHHLAKITLTTKINFGNKYLSRPDGKYNLRNEKYPTLFMGYEKAFAASDKKYEYDALNARLFYTVTAGNKGNLALNMSAGKFFNAKNISFIDYKHFNGNQTHIGQSERYLNVFNLLPYYTSSTNDAYFETHIEHDDKGFIMNKIPLLNKLKSNLILGFHNLAIPDRKPYQEFALGLDHLGIGKFRILRIDYVRSYQQGYLGDGVIFDLKFLNLLE